MSDEPTSLYERAQREPAAWHATHPDATFYEMEQAVEVQIERLRTALLETRTDDTFSEEWPACPPCGITMVRRARRRKRLVLKGDAPLDLERSFVVCPTCGEGLFPPG